MVKKVAQTEEAIVDRLQWVVMKLLIGVQKNSKLQACLVFL